MRDLVRKESCFTDVLAVEKMIREAGGGRGQIEGGEVGDGSVAQGAPCCGERQEGEEGSRQGRKILHIEQLSGEKPVEWRWAQQNDGNALDIYCAAGSVFTCWT